MPCEQKIWEQLLYTCFILWGFLPGCEMIWMLLEPLLDFPSVLSVLVCALLASLGPLDPPPTFPADTPTPWPPMDAPAYNPPPDGVLPLPSRTPPNPAATSDLPFPRPALAYRPPPVERFIIFWKIQRKMVFFLRKKNWIAVLTSVCIVTTECPTQTSTRVCTPWCPNASMETTSGSGSSKKTS